VANGGPPSYVRTQAGLEIADIDVFEINEAFASQAPPPAPRPRHLPSDWHHLTSSFASQARPAPPPPPPPSPRPPMTPSPHLC
jgi:hypothetical protein